MGIITGGYDGTVDEVQFAGLLPRYSVLGPDDFKATTQAGDRIVSIGNGTALGPGTIDVATNLPAIQFAVATGTRWDLVVLRRDWQPPGGVSEIKIIEGGTAEAYPAVGTATTAWNRRPGIMDDQPLYLQQVNGTQLGPRIDLRCWSSHGGLVALSDKAKTYLETLGAEVRIGGTKWCYVPGANNVPEWLATGGDTTTYAPTGVTNWSTTGAINVTVEGSKKRVTVDLTFKRTGPDTPLTNLDLVTLSAPIPLAARGAAPTKYVPAWLVGGGNNIQIGAALNTGTGVLFLMAVLDPITIKTNAQFTLNLSYYID